MVAAIVVGSSLVLRATDLPIAVLVGFYAIYDILRHGRIFRR